jgi:hypothetical protein
MTPLDPRILAYETGFSLSALFNIDGPGVLLQDLEKHWADPVKRETLLETARPVESRPELLAATAHLLAVGQK